MKSICIKCGNVKTKAYSKCKLCKFKPITKEDVVKSVYLSSGRYENENQINEYELLLEKLSKDIKNCIEIDYDSKEINRLEKQYDSVNSITLIDIIKALIKIFYPVIIFFISLIIIYLIIKFIKQYKG